MRSCARLSRVCKRVSTAWTHRQMSWWNQMHNSRSKRKNKMSSRTQSPSLTCKMKSQSKSKATSQSPLSIINSKVMSYSFHRQLWSILLTKYSFWRILTMLSWRRSAPWISRTMWSRAPWKSSTISSLRSNSHVMSKIHLKRQPRLYIVSARSNHLVMNQKWVRKFNLQLHTSLWSSPSEAIAKTQKISQSWSYQINICPPMRTCQMGPIISSI